MPVSKEHETNLRLELLRDAIYDVQCDLRDKKIKWDNALDRARMRTMLDDFRSRLDAEMSQWQ